MPSPAPAAPVASPAAPQAPDPPASLPLALLGFHRHVGPIFKGTDAKYGKFADLRTVLDAVTPPLLDQGLVLCQTIEHQGDGTTLLTTRLIHALSGEEISSRIRLPDLDTQLARLHELRLAALQRFPLDLQLAANGSLPPVLPPRQPAIHPPAPDQPGTPAAAGGNGNGAGPVAPAGAGTPQGVAPMAQRLPGLRLDDQLRGLHVALQSLGTTTNPLHAIGGALTYFRRYAILALLSLAAEDNDGSDYGGAGEEPQAPPRSRSRRQSAPPNPVAAPQATPRPSPSRSRRSAAPQPAVQQSGPEAPTAAAPEQASAPQAAPAAAEHHGDPEQAAPPAAPLSSDEIQALIGSIRSLPNQQIPQLIAAFRQQFQLPENVLISDYLSTQAHARFIAEHIAQLEPVAV